jgi:hypothetical protein
MSNRLPILVAGMMCGAGVLFGVQHMQARAARSQAAAPVADEMPSIQAAPTAFAPAGAPNLALDAVGRRLERIEQKLESASSPATQTKVEAEHAETTLIKGASPSDRDAEQQKAFDGAASVVDSAVHAGIWIDGDQKAMREASAQLLPADRFTLKMRLSVAANEGKLRDLATQPFFF